MKSEPGPFLGFVVGVIVTFVVLNLFFKMENRRPTDTQKLQRLEEARERHRLDVTAVPTGDNPVVYEHAPLGLFVQVDGKCQEICFGNLLKAKEKKIGATGPILHGSLLFNLQPRGSMVFAHFIAVGIVTEVTITQADLDQAHEFFDFNIVHPRQDDLLCDDSECSVGNKERKCEWYDTNRKITPN